MKQLIYISLILLLLAGCKTTRKTTRHEVTQIETAQLDVIALRSELKTIETKESDALRTRVVETTKEKTTVTEYSEPDSVGNQYITKTTTTERTQEAVTQADLDKEQETIEKTIIAENFHGNAITETEFKSATDTQIREKKKAPTWLVIAAMAGSLLIILIIYKYGKKLV